MSLYQLLFSIEYGSLDSQSLLGRGIVDLPYESYFAGKLTGADGVDSELDTNLTGVGTGSNGETPVVYRGAENLWGNIWEFIAGYLAVDSEYRIMRTDGEWGNKDPDNWTTSDYEVSEATPLTDGAGDSDDYIKDVLTEQLLKYGFLPSEVGGSSSTYIPDFFWIHDQSQQNILLAGGHWALEVRAGLCCLFSRNDASRSAQSIGYRLEFVG